MADEARFSDLNVMGVFSAVPLSLERGSLDCVGFAGPCQIVGDQHVDFEWKDINIRIEEATHKMAARHPFSC